MLLTSYNKTPRYLPTPEATCDIIVLGHNRSDMTAQCLYQLFNINHGVRATVTFVDNASTDATKKVLGWYRTNTKRWVPWARYKGFPFRSIHNDKNLGFSEANNNAARLGKSEWICFLNNDTVLPDHGWLGLLIGTAQYKDWAAVGPCSNAVLGIQQDCWNLEWPLTHESKFLSGFCMVVRRDVFELIGGFDEQFYYGEEDLDLSIRIRKAGWKLGVNRLVNVKHLNQATLSTLTDSPGAHYAQTRQQLTLKWGEQTLRDLFIWPELVMSKEEWRRQGVLEDGFFSFFPGTPTDVCERLCELRTRSVSTIKSFASLASMGELLGGYRFAGVDDCYRATCGNGDDCGKLEAVFGRCEKSPAQIEKEDARTAYTFQRCRSAN